MPAQPWLGSFSSFKSEKEKLEFSLLLTCCTPFPSQGHLTLHSFALLLIVCGPELTLPFVLLSKLLLLK